MDLRWCNSGNGDLQDIFNILESLQQHFDLKELRLTFYGGSKLWRWINNPAYADLTSITMSNCINFELVPSIGELPSLKILHTVYMDNVRNINKVICRNDQTKVVNAFPRMEKLTLENIPALVEWTGVEYGDFICLRHISIRYFPELRLLPSMSHLKHLEIIHCTHLVSLTEGLLSGLVESLIIRGCSTISERCRKYGGEDWFKIASVRNIWIDLEKLSLD